MNANALILTERRVGPRIFDGLLTCVAWAGFIFFAYKNLLLQLVAFPDQRGEVITGSLNTVLIYLLMAAINGWLLILWYQYSLRRHSARYHSSQAPLHVNELAQSFNVPPQLISEMSQHNLLTVYHDQIGQIVDLKSSRAESERA
ncbi:poly-beta-1,6-N-acetyl-D-glucosamine biosynthesis protein PgaD [Cedecea sp.]|jgi:biofilm PGA synthesis protein PgaD|uniref:poly-beta-1,6-N-acetyl-D-glucosamine biosynthesis protein PgaD n=1 Tax=Cedecea sp. TaxID=1970739 RepID=UPI0012AEAB8C|nr:poly-beta-1,6-N-acetyl-D-glucosamine biosynthesis protein PgaD [Enterobacteriaceae bacterium RIT693]